MIDIFKNLRNKEPEFKCVVRLITSSWWGSRGDMCIEKHLITLQRKSIGYGKEILVELMMDENIFPLIENFYTLEDGLYECKFNYSESGYFDCREIELDSISLIPYVEKTE